MSFQLFDKIRAFMKSAGVYGHENLLQNQNNINRAIQNNELINYSSTGLLDQTNLQINRMERYKDYDQMDEMGEISLALDLYADESTQIDPETKHSIAINAKSEEVKEELERLFFDKLHIDNKLRAMVRYLCKYGDLAAEVIPNEDRTEISSFRPFNIYSFLRVETKYGDLVGFFFTDEMMGEPEFLHPWQVMHLRLTSYENIYAPYGRSLLEGGRKDFRRLRLMEDAALIYRITRAPEKRIFTIPVGNIPTNQIEQYLNAIADQFKKHRFFDPATGEVNWRYAPLIQEDDFWLPQRPDGTGPKIDKMEGAENLDQIADIVYFKKKMIAPLKIPFSRVGIGEDAGANADKSLASSHTDFAKAVQFVQQEVCAGLKKIALIHLALKGFSAEDMSNFDVSMTTSSAIDELYRIETWNSRAGVIATLQETNLFPDDWILERFTDMTENEIEELQERKKKESESEAAMPELGMEEEGGEEGELAGLGLPGLEDIDKQQRKVLIEYQKMKKARDKQIAINKTQTFVDSFNYMLNNNELDGLPAAKSANEDNIIVENKRDDDPFSIIAPSNDMPRKNVEKYAILPLIESDEEAKNAMAANRDILTQVSAHEDATEMVYTTRIADEMDRTST